MQSNDDVSTNDSNSPSKPGVALLRREVPAYEQRQRSMILAGLLSFAGVALGFGLGQMTANDHCSRTVVVETAPGSQHAAHVPHRMHAPRERGVTWLGVVYEARDGGALVTRVIPGSPAETAGIKAGQRILGFGDTPIRTGRDLLRAVRRSSAGDHAKLRVESATGDVSTHEVTLGQLSAAEYGAVFRTR